jgi:hypothetical protein
MTWNADFFSHEQHERVRRKLGRGECPVLVQVGFLRLWVSGAIGKFPNRGDG